MREAPDTAEFRALQALSRRLASEARPRSYDTVPALSRALVSVMWNQQSVIPRLVGEPTMVLSESRPGVFRLKITGRQRMYDNNAFEREFLTRIELYRRGVLVLVTVNHILGDVSDLVMRGFQGVDSIMSAVNEYVVVLSHGVRSAKPAHAGAAVQ